MLCILLLTGLFWIVTYWPQLVVQEQSFRLHQNIWVTIMYLCHFLLFQTPICAKSLLRTLSSPTPSVMTRKGLWKWRTQPTPVQGHKPGLSSWECNQHSEQALPARGSHKTTNSAMQTAWLTLTPSATFHKDWHVSRVQEGWQMPHVSHGNSHHHKWPYLRNSPHRGLCCGS